MLVDANILLYSVDSESAQHGQAAEWLTSALNGSRQVGLPWPSLYAFVRIATNPRATQEPLSAIEAWAQVEDWLAAPAAWIPQPGRGHRAILGRLVRELDLRAGLLTDGVLAAICIEHGLSVVSADSDFARFTELEWVNPMAT